ncbi:hypothetical protein [Paenibacillus sp. EKM211P]|uniref:hypothetical protein n=1 Tax=Paenibacillus sp. EKM211P TaxID=1683679 RepID=UPI0013E951F3|nr:hypothetical protein [Paenibacillus sp. EKM211P]KAF6585177.1 hypothetical protein G9G57_07430 [Paenibacillus sp. EKM211P]
MSRDITGRMLFIEGENGEPIPVSTKNPIPFGGGSGGGTITADSITDATTTGKALVKATDAAAARTAIGAGTSSLTLGTGAGNAAAGNHTHVMANITDLATALNAKTNKSAFTALTPLADPATATTTQIATLLNSVVAALKA